MKKYFYLAAVSAMMLTACSSENDVVQPTPAQPTNPVAVQQQAVAFDTYLSGTTASTRAGYEGVMTTEQLKKAEAGFGVFAYYQDHVDYADGALTPNFMYNQKVTWNAGWGYSPLKYWPNETLTDSQTDPATSPTASKPDKLSFFAYAPYVDHTTSLGSNGITGFVPANNIAGDPKVTFAINTDPDHNVDLLWGVAPAGFSYTDVSSGTTSVPVGMPLKDLVKPDKDQKVKFLFQHALSRIGLSVVSAIDQIAAGDDAGTFSKDPTTKVLIKEVSIKAPFGTGGQLNLNNTTSNVANWDVTTTDDGTAALFTITNAATSYLAPDLRYDATTISDITKTEPTKTFADLNTGVLPSEQALLAGDADKKLDAAPTFDYGKVYYTKASATAGEKGYIVAKTSATAPTGGIFTKDDNGSYTQVFAADATVSLNGYSPEYYSLPTLTVIANGEDLPETYYVKSTSGDKYTKTTRASAGAKADADDTYYNVVDFTKAFVGTEYAAGNYWSALIPRYYMVIPTGAAIDIAVNIKYAVVTNDAKLAGTISNVENDITKTVSVDLKSGKSYNLKLILGLTSVKLDATVADWKVADETEIFLPQNNE